MPSALGHLRMLAPGFTPTFERRLRFDNRSSRKGHGGRVISCWNPRMRASYSAGGRKGHLEIMQKYHCAGLSLRVLMFARNGSLIGIFRFTPAGGIGDSNHFL